MDVALDCESRLDTLLAAKDAEIARLTAIRDECMRLSTRQGSRDLRGCGRC